jgi:hypothetical protein
LFVSGAVVAFAARRALVAQKPNPFGRSAWVTVGYALFFWATVSWFSWRHPDWMLCYFIDATTLPMLAVHMLFAICLVLAALSGHTLTAALLQRQQTLAAIAVLLGGVLTWFGLWGITIDRYMAMGSYADWVQGTTTLLTESSAAGALNLVGVIQVFVGGTLLVSLARSGRRLRAR